MAQKKALYYVNRDASGNWQAAGLKKRDSPDGQTLTHIDEQRTPFRVRGGTSANRAEVLKALEEETGEPCDVVFLEDDTPAPPPSNATLLERLARLEAMLGEPAPNGIGTSP